nr:PREDICTED: alkaline phosphatase-like [Bemisia tabaci]
MIVLRWITTVFSTLLLLLLRVDFTSNVPIPSTPLLDKSYWYEEARLAMKLRLGDHRDTRRERAKNVVLLVADGAGLPTFTATRIFKGQRQGKQGENTELAWDKFPAVALVKTYNLDAQIGESSACATALMCGVKANFETVGLDAGGKFENCFSTTPSKVDSLINWAQQEGKSTGIVTNTRITHATPAALYAHSASRYWEDDAKIPPASRKSCKDIARQLVEDEPGRNINVVLGGGRRHWLPKVATDPQSTKDEGRRLDGRNLMEDWLRDRKRRGIPAEYVWNKTQLDNVSPLHTDHLLGLFAYSHMNFEADRDKGPDGDPSLTDMTLKAVSILSRNPRGFFLFIESGRIDHAHHYNNAYRALDETLQLETALLAVMSLVNQTETLFVVTSDHSHVMTLGGLSTSRGNPILGVDSKVSDVDGLPYTTLLYGNGPGHQSPRILPSNATVGDPNIVQSAAVPRRWATHGGEDVPLFAKGPLAAALFSGTLDQSYIPHAVAFAACLGHHRRRCQAPASPPGHAPNQTATTVSYSQPIQACAPPDPSSASEPGHSKAGAAKVLASSELSENHASIHQTLIKNITLYLLILTYLHNAIT